MPPASPDLPGYRTLISLAWPIVLARATQSVVGFADAVMVAPLGETPLAAVTTGALNVFLMVILPMGTVFILQSFAAQLRGRGDLGSVRRYAWYGLLIALLAELAALATIPFLSGALSLFGHTQAVHDAMTSYMAIRLLSVGFAVGTEALGNWYGGLGNTRIAMIAGVTTMIANVALNYLLIEPHFGLRGFGVEGAAAASTVSSALGFGVVAWLFVRHKGHDALPPDVGPLRTRELWRVLRFGVPNGVNFFLEFAAFIVFINVVVAHLGTSVLAAFNVVMQINSVSFMPAFGLASAGAILVGEALGKREPDHVWPIVRRTATIACVWMVSVGLVYLAVPSLVMSLFQPRDVPSGPLLKVGVLMLMMSAAWQLFDALGMTVSEALRAAGDTTWCMVARIILAWVFFTPVSAAAILLYDGGVVTLMILMIVYLALIAAVFAWRFAAGQWRRIDLVGEPEVI